jgi:hypothetical protein
MTERLFVFLEPEDRHRAADARDEAATGGADAGGGDDMRARNREDAGALARTGNSRRLTERTSSTC